MRGWRIFATADPEPDRVVILRRLNVIIEKEKAEKKAKELASRVVRFPEGARWDLPQSGNRVIRTIERRQ